MSFRTCGGWQLLVQVYTIYQAENGEYSKSIKSQGNGVCKNSVLKREPPQSLLPNSNKKNKRDDLRGFNTENKVKT